MKNFLAGVATVDMFDGDKLIATAKTLLDSSISIGSSFEDVRGGSGNQLYGKYFHTSVFDVNLTDVMFKLEYIAFQTGSAITMGADVFATEEVTLTEAGKITVSSSPEDVQGYGKIAWVTTPGSEIYETVTYDEDHFVYPEGKVGDVVCIKYVRRDAASKKIVVSSSFIPSTVRLVMRANLFQGDSSNISSATKAGFITVDVPRFLFNGSQELSMTSSGVSNTPIGGSALSTTSADCDETGYYAIITETLSGAKWYDNVFALAIEDDAVSVAVAGKKTLSVYAIPKTGSAFKPPYADLTFTSAASGTATVDASGVVTGVEAGDTIVTVAIKDKTAITANADVTVTA